MTGPGKEAADMLHDRRLIVICQAKFCVIRMALQGVW